MQTSRLTCSLFTLCSVSFLYAGDWPGWRGPHFNGSSDETGLPARISLTENILWKTPVVGPAASSPVVSGGKVFLTTAHADTKTLTAMCYDAADGKLLWKVDSGTGYSIDERSNFASPSPVTDGKLVVFHFGSGDTVACDFTGKELWRRNLQTDYGSWAIQWTPASSPLLHGGQLVFQVLQRDVAFEYGGIKKGTPGKPMDSYLLALDPATGKELWKCVRPSEAIAEAREAFSTPMPWVHGTRAELLISGGDCITGHDPKSGAELWRWGTYNPKRIAHYRLVPSPIAGGDAVLVCGPKKEPIFAIKAGKSGVLTDADLAWTSGDEVNSKHVTTDVSTPLFYRGKFFVLNSDRKELYAIEPATGKMLWSCRMDGAKLEGSPSAGDGKIYVQDHAAKLYIIDAEPTRMDGEIRPLSAESLVDGPVQKDVRSTVALADSRVYIRTGTMLYCAGLRK